MRSIRNRIQQFKEHVLFLRELRMRPEIVLVVVFDTEDDTQLAGYWQHFIDARHRPFEAVLPTDTRKSLTTQHTANSPRPAEPLGHTHHLNFTINRTFANI